MNKTDVKIRVNVRDEFHFSEVHRSMNATGPVQSYVTPEEVHGSMTAMGPVRSERVTLWASLSLLVTRCVHTSMNLRKMKFISLLP